MGKAALFYVAAAVMMMTSVYATSSQRGVETDIEQNAYEEQVLAREIAYSAFNLAVARTREDFGGYRPDDEGVPYANGSYDILVASSAADEVDIEVTGYYGEAWHSVTAEMEQLGDASMEALTVDGPVDNLEGNSSYLISGLDASVGGNPGTGPGPNTNGGRFLLTSAYSEALASLDAAHVIGIGSSENPSAPDVIEGEGPVDLDALASAIAAHGSVTVISEDTKFEDSDVYGTTASPVYMVIEGDLEMKGDATGAGALLVKGDLTMKDDASWVGLIVVQADGGVHELKGDAAIWGALVVRSVTESGESGGDGDAGLLGGHFDVDVFDGEDDREYHKHQYDDSYDQTWVDALTTGGDAAIGEYWEDLVKNSGYESVRIELVNRHNVAGTLTYEETDYGYTGSAEDPFSRDGVDPNEITALSVDFSDLCSLRGTSPGDVSGDAADRDGAFTIRVYGEGESSMSSNDLGESHFALMPSPFGMAGLTTLIPGRVVEAFASMLAPATKITICHYPPGNPANVQTISISESAWPAHDAHGDHKGDCNPADDDDGGGDAEGSEDPDGGGDDDSSPDGGGDGDGGGESGSDDETLIYELSVYHHIKGDECSGELGGDGDEGGEEGSDSGIEPIDLELKDDARVLYSSDALRLLTLDGVGVVGQEQAVILTGANETSGN